MFNRHAILVMTGIHVEQHNNFVCVIPMGSVGMCTYMYMCT